MIISQLHLKKDIRKRNKSLIYSRYTFRDSATFFFYENKNHLFVITKQPICFINKYTLNIYSKNSEEEMFVFISFSLDKILDSFRNYFKYQLEPRLKRGNPAFNFENNDEI